ncbi:hypothetical protein EYZ11_006895 [Aspergillus tanneri]|uniref:FAD-binding domain-containing protein n=1 Tax=Aspergillus tanneri TaxID=1220188 RepID=A0A4S3JJY7_9EURO|nr:hypothetical protein EYZ11_006895 [Aspergillus tanneri]
MTRLYVQLSSTDGEKVDKRMATPEYVMHRAVEAMRPFNLRWKTIEWFGNYVVGQRAARHFADDENRVFIAGDAGHCHSALAAQGANTSMHDSFNLAWKINLVVRGLANRRILRTYEDERRKIAKDLISFDAKHCEAFAQGDDALARNFDENIRFISGVGAEYSPGPLTLETQVVSGLRPGALMVPARVVRYIDANPVDIQIDIPLLGFLQTVCEKVDSGLKELNGLAQQSYQKRPRGWAKKDELLQPQRYTSVSHFLTFALVTRSSRSLFEVVDLPDVLQKSRWTLYLDELDNPTCTEKWMGDVKSSQAGIAIVRPDGYAGGMGCWTVEQGEQAAQWTQDYFQICRCI